MSENLIDITRTFGEAIESLSEAEIILKIYDSWGWNSNDEIGLIRGISEKLKIYFQSPKLLLDPTEISYLIEIRRQLDFFRATDKFLYSEGHSDGSTLIHAVASVAEIIQDLNNITERIKLFESAELPPSSTFISLNEKVSELILKIVNNPVEWHALGPRKFEEILAEIWHKLGWETVLTPPAGDGGIDIRAVRNQNGIWLCYLIEAKSYNPSRPVGIEFVRSLYGVVERERATHGILATTSYFTRGAIEESRALKYRVSLADFEQVYNWANEYKNLMLNKRKRKHLGSGL